MGTIYTNKKRWIDLGSLCILLIFMLIYGKGYGETIIDKFSLLCGIVIVPVLFLYFLKLRKFERMQFDKIALKYAILSVLFLALSAPIWYSFYNAYVYIGVIFAYLVYLIDCNKFRSLIVYALVLCTFLEMFEYFTEQYFYVVSYEDMELDEKLFSGGAAFRAKGIFKGPLSVGPFAVLTYLLNTNKRWVLPLSFVACFFANSRTGLVILSMLFLIQLLGGRINIKYVAIAIALGIIFFLALLSNSFFMASVERILDVSNSESNTNQTRIFFWLAGISTYFNYSVPNLIFGNNGFFRSIYDNNPESGWICLLTDCGMIGFVLYILPLLYCLKQFYKRKEMSFFFITLIFMLMNFVITANLSATSNIVYWIFVFELYNKAKYSVCKYDLKPNVPARKEL